MSGTPRRYGQWAGTVLFVVVTALAAGWLYVHKGGTTEVLVVDRPVAAGEVIEEQDLGSAQVSGVDAAVPVADLAQVVGTRAVTGLVPGQVLIRGATTSNPVPAAGQRMVAVHLDAGRVPATMEAGAVVNVLAAPPSGDAGDPAGLENPALITEGGKVFAIKATVDGSYVLSLLVDEADADRLAAYSAAGRVTVVQTSAAGE